MNKPFLSIVIANYNYGHFLEDAIKSIAAQDMGEEVEIIVCDAASTDNSVEIIKKYAGGLPPNIPRSEWHPSSSITHSNPLISWWCSERDGGQSAAFNKGFSHANGRFLTWLNADDVMLPGVVKSLKRAVKQNRGCEWFVGGVMWLDPMLHVFKCGRARRMSRFRANRGLVNVCGPSSFFSKSLFERAGKCDERFKYTMDSDLWLRFAVVQHAVFKPFIKYAWGLRLHPAAKMSGHKFTEDGKILEGVDSQLAFTKNVERQKHLDDEHRWTDEKIGIIRVPISKTLQIVSADFLPALLSRIDSWRYKGLSLVEVLKGLA